MLLEEEKRVTPDVIRGIEDKYDARLRHGYYLAERNDGGYSGCGVGLIGLAHGMKDQDLVPKPFVGAAAEVTGLPRDYLMGVDDGFEGSEDYRLNDADNPQLYQQGVSDGQALQVYANERESYTV